MSMIDFTQEARDQGCLHIVVKPLGDAGSSLVKSVLKVLRDMAPIQLPELKSSVLFLRFLDGRDLPSWASGANKWDQFSAHKTVHGMLAVGHSQEASGWTPVVQKYKEARKAFLPDLCASKCLVYGPKDVLEPCQGESGRDGPVLVHCAAEPWDVAPSDIQSGVLEAAATDLARTIFVSLKTRMEPYLIVLEDPGRGDSKTTSMRLKAPLESKDPMEDELDQKSTRNNLARISKHVGDLCLLIGQLQKASHWYQWAADQLKSQKEWLWAGSAFEGLSVTAMMTKEREQVLGQKAQGVGAPSALSKLMVKVHHGNSRATVRGSPGGPMSGSLPRSGYTLDPRRLGEFSFTRGTRFSSLKRNAPRAPSPSELDHLDLQGGGGTVISNRGRALLLGDNEEEEDVEEEVEEDRVGEEEGVGMEAMMEELKREEEDGVLSLIVDSRLLHKDFIEAKFSVALVCYRKAGKVGTVPLLESTLKFARYLVKQKRFVQAADSLQKTARIDGISDPDKLSLYQTMAAIFNSMGYHRKEAMFHLYAARLASSIANSNQHRLLSESHKLLLRSLPGYRLSVDVDSLPSTAASHIGWPSLQAVVLKDFVYLSRRLGEELDVIKYACYLLQVFSRHMGVPSLKGVTNTLEGVVRGARERCVSSPEYAASVSGKLASPIPLTQFPLIHSFHPRPLIAIRIPRQHPGFAPKQAHINNLKATAAGDGGSAGKSNPFIYSPFAAGHKKAAKRKEVLWVEGDPAEIGLSIANPLPFELRVENMTLLFEGAGVEIFPSSLTLPGGSEQSHFTLVSIPQEPGIVNVLGYEAMVFGVRYECYKKVEDDPVIRVVPRLPLVRIKSVLVQASSDGTTEEEAEREENRRSLSDVVSPATTTHASVDKLELLDGESCEFDLEISLLNTISVTFMKASIKPYKNDEYCKFSWDTDTLQTQLPLPPSRTAKLRVSAQADIPHYFRLINDFSAGVISSTVAADNRRMIEVPGNVAGDLMGKGTPPRRSITPTLSSSSEKGENEVDQGHHARSALMESLNLERPSFPVRTNSSASMRSTTLRHSSPSDDSTKSPRSTTPVKKARPRHVESGRRDIMGWNYDDIEFHLDKRASIRSDPGERGDGGVGGKSRFAYLKSRGRGSAHTSPTSSITTLSALTDSSNPISIPSATGTDDADYSARGTPGSKAEPQSLKVRPLARNSSLRTHKTSAPTLPRGIDKGDISAPTGPVKKDATQPIIRKVTVEVSFSFEYSGGVSEGYYREAISTMTATVRPCLLFEQFDVTICTKSQELFQVAFVTHNVSSYSLLVTCDVQQADLASHGGTALKKEVMAANSRKKFVLLLRRFSLDNEGSQPSKDSIQLAKQYSKRLAKMLKFGWEVKGSSPVREGSLSLEGLHLPVSMATIMQPLPVSFSVYLNQELCSPLVPIHSKSLGCGELTHLSVKLQNNSSSVFPVSYLVLEPYWFSDELRKIVKGKTGKILHSNTLVTRVPQLIPGAMFEHKVCLTFLYKGNFFVDTKCMYRPQTETSEGCGTEDKEKKRSNASGKGLTYCAHQSSDEVDGISRHQVAQSPPKAPDKSKLPDLSLTSSSLPVSFSPPQPSPPRLTPPPPSSKPPSPPLRPKGTKALVKKFESEFAARKKSLAGESSPRRSSKQVSVERVSLVEEKEEKEETDSGNTSQSGKGSSKETLTNVTANETPKNSEDMLDKSKETPDNSIKASDKSAKETSEDSKETSEDSKETSDNSKEASDKSEEPSHHSSSNPPPIPTSKRPLLNLARNAAVNLADSRPASKASALSSSSASPANGSRSGSYEKKPVVHKGRKSKLIGDAEYHFLLEDKNKESGLVQVVVGPHFSFEIS